MTRIDPYLNVEFEPTRSNQIYKNRASQIAHNNQKARSKRMNKAYIDNILDKNREILLSIMKNANEIIVSDTFLKEHDYNASYHTHALTSNGENYWCVYEFKLTRINENEIKIIRNA